MATPELTSRNRAIIGYFVVLCGFATVRSLQTEIRMWNFTENTMLRVQSIDAGIMLDYYVPDASGAWALLPT